jgi:transposase
LRFVSLRWHLRGGSLGLRDNRSRWFLGDDRGGRDLVIARCLGRLKDFRRIATRYDKLAGTFFSALCLVAIVAYWL